MKTANNRSVLLSSFSSLKVYFFVSAVKHISEQFIKSCNHAYKSLKCNTTFVSCVPYKDWSLLLCKTPMQSGLLNFILNQMTLFVREMMEMLSSIINKEQWSFGEAE